MGRRRYAGEPTRTEPVAVVDTEALQEAMTEALEEDLPIPAGRLLGLPELPGDGVWVDIAGAALVAGVRPNTISSWLARAEPRGNPFPAPTRILYRNYWPLDWVQNWKRNAVDEPW